MTPSVPEQRGGAYYFGTWQRSGHYMFDTGMRSVNVKSWHGCGLVLPWDKIDGQLNPDREVQGVCNLHHKDGWTALAFANRTDDSRPGSNGVFFFNDELDFDAAVSAVREHFPQVIERFDFELVRGTDNG